MGLVATHYVLYQQIGLAETVTATLERTPLPETITDDLSGIVPGATALAAVTALFIGARPSFERLFDHEYTTGRVLGAAGIAFGLLVVSVPLELLLDTADPIEPLPIAALGIASAFVIGYLLFPRLLTVGTSAPNEAQQARIRDCYGTLERTPARVAITDKAPLFYAVDVVGRGRRRRVLIDEAFLERASDDALTVAIAYAEGKHRRWFWELAWAMLALSLLSMIVLISPIIGWWTEPWNLLGLVGLGSILVINRTVKRSIYRADAFAVDVCGAETVRNTYEAHGDSLTHFMAELPAIKPLNPLVSMRRRLERLD